MKLFNDQAAAAVASLDSADAAYCAKLEQRFAHMGISSKAASSAVQSLVEADAVPQVGVWAALPSAFKGLFQKKTEAKPSPPRRSRLLCPKRSPRFVAADASALPHGATSSSAPCCRACICRAIAWCAESPTLKPCRLPISHPGQPRFSQTQSDPAKVGGVASR